MQNRLYLLFLIGMLTLISCDCFLEGQGVVYDSISKEPMDSVYVESLLDGEFMVSEMYTDSTGAYFGESTGNCRELHIRISKRGYQSVTLIDIEKQDVYLVKKVF